MTSRLRMSWLGSRTLTRRLSALIAKGVDAREVILVSIITAKWKPGLREWPWMNIWLRIEQETLESISLFATRSNPLQMLRSRLGQPLKSRFSKNFRVFLLRRKAGIGIEIGEGIESRSSPIWRIRTLKSLEGLGEGPSYLTSLTQITDLN